MAIRPSFKVIWKRIKPKINNKEKVFKTDKIEATIMTQLVTKVLDLEIKTRALTELLVKSGNITMEELKETYDVIENRDFANTKEDLMVSLEKAFK